MRRRSPGHGREAGSLRLVLLAAGVVVASLAVQAPVGAADAPSAPASTSAVAAGALGRIAAEDILLRSAAGVAIPAAGIGGSDPQAGVDGSRPPGATPLQAVFARADDAVSWADARVRRTVTPASQATAILAELGLAHLFMTTAPTPDADRANLHVTAAKAQADWALVNLVAPAGDVVSWSDGTAEPASRSEAWLLLEALSALSAVTGAHSDAPFSDPAFAPWFADGAALVHHALQGAPPQTLGESSLAARALTAYVDVPGTDRSSVTDRIVALVDAMPSPEGLVEQALTVRALSAAHDVTSDPGYLQEIEATLGMMLDEIDIETGAVQGPVRLSIWDVADVVAALAAGPHDGTHARRAAAAVEALVEHLVVAAGLMPAVPTADNPLVPGPERGPASPAVDDGKRWAFGAAATYSPDRSRWEVLDHMVDVPGALYAATELMSLDEVTAPVAADAPEDPGHVALIEITASEFGFSPTTIEGPAGGEVVLRLRNDGAIEHDVDIPALGVHLDAGPGQTAETLVTLPATATTAPFSCSLPGHAQAGMTGTIEVGLPPSEGDVTPASAASLQVDGRFASPTLLIAVVFALGLFLATMTFIVGMLQFMKDFGE